MNWKELDKKSFLSEFKKMKMRDNYMKETIKIMISNQRKLFNKRNYKSKLISINKKRKFDKF